jgi:hypothetical protein
MTIETFMILLITLLCLTLLPAFYLLGRSQKREVQSDFKGSEVMALHLNKTEYYKSLNFMLMYGVITFEEYNELQMKALPYLKG